MYKTATEAALFSTLLAVTSLNRARKGRDDIISYSFIVSLYNFLHTQTHHKVFFLIIVKKRYS